MELRFLSTLSLRRATRLGLPGWLRTLISIHALLAESDVLVWFFFGGVSDFYPRSPCGERRINRDVANGKREFLSTLSLRRATFVMYLLTASLFHFYPRSPCGERRKSNKLAGSKLVFLSTLSLRRATESIGTLRTVSVNFYPRSPCGERPFEKPENVITTKISIHALLAESDALIHSKHS